MVSASSHRSSFQRRVAAVRGRPARPTAPFAMRYTQPRSMARRSTLVLPRHEIKVVDTQVTGVVFSTTSVFTPANVIVQGTNFFNRVGSKVAMKSLYVNLFVSPSGAGQAGTDYGRVMLVYDKQANTAFPTFSQLLQDYSQSGATTTNSASGLNMTNRERFIVLMDERLVLSPIGAGSASTTAFTDPVSTTFKINRFIKLKDLTAMYNQTNGGTIADIQTGSLFLYTLGQYAAADSGYEITGTMRLKYDDV